LITVVVVVERERKRERKAERLARDDLFP